MIRLAKPWLDEHERQAIADVLESGLLVQGERVQQFEAALAQRCSRKHAVVVSSGTAALELALRALDIGANDRVVCPGLTWPSPAHAVELVGATLVLTDVEMTSWNIDVALVSERLDGPPKAIIAIDQFGNPAPFEALKEKYPNALIIEDAACAIGSTLGGTPCGSFGDISCLSFHPRKVLTTGEGGACLTDDAELADRLRVLRNHGQKSPGVFVTAASNYRLTEMGAAMGLSQLDKLDEIVSRRQAIADRYHRELPALEFQEIAKNATSNFQTMGAMLSKTYNRDARDGFVQECRKNGVEVGALSYSLDRVGSLRSPSEPLSNARTIADRGVALPLYAQMTEQEQSTVIRTVREVLQ
ncbi:MAG: DegT/DnrJ/EryC1/StrS family aminotransferase [Polyangiales bacterium]